MKKIQKQTSVTIKTVNKIFHTKLNLLIYQTAKIILKTMILKNFTQRSTEKHISHNTRANNSKKSGNKKSAIILGDSMTKLLNYWEMAKRIQSMQSKL